MIIVAGTDVFNAVPSFVIPAHSACVGPNQISSFPYMGSQGNDVAPHLMRQSRSFNRVVEGKRRWIPA